MSDKRGCLARQPRFCKAVPTNFFSRRFRGVLMAVFVAAKFQQKDEHFFSEKQESVVLPCMVFMRKNHQE